MSARTVAEVVAGYTAQVPAEHWAIIAPLVRDAVTSAGCGSVGTVRQYLSLVSGFVHWVWQTTGTALEGPRVFHPSLVGRYLHEQLRSHSINYRRVAARRLSTLAALYSDAPVVSPRHGEQHAATLYTERELVEFRSSAARRSNHARRRNAHLLLALGAGAGLRTAEIAATCLHHIVDHGDHLTVEVPGKQSRTVVVLDAWAQCLRTGVDGRTGDDFAFTGYRVPGYPARVVHQLGIDDPTEPTPAASRLRVGWMVGHLNSGVPVNLLLQQAGLKGTMALDAFVRAMRPHLPDDHRDLLAGRTVPR